MLLPGVLVSEGICRLGYDLATIEDDMRQKVPPIGKVIPGASIPAGAGRSVTDAALAPTFLA